MRTKRIFKNTIFLYMRQFVLVAINLYTIRILLNTLGVEDYGIFTVVAGFVMLLTFLPGTMASATQRFFSYALGQNDNEVLNKTFSANWILYVLIAVLILLVLESAGLWYVMENLKIPDNRVSAAIELYHYTAFSFALTVFSAPFIAILIAHEDMHIYAIVSIIEAALKLLAAICLTYLPLDNLTLYGKLLLAVAITNSGIYIYFCVTKYAECQFKKIYWDSLLVKQILGFTGWTMFGQVSTVFRNQAITVLLNQFFNPATVAARAISVTVASQVIVFAQNFNMGLYPSIIQTYASNQKNEMYELIYNGSKLTFFLMWIFSLPLLIEMQYILNLWLKTPPAEAVIFTQLSIVEALIMSVSLPMTTAARAPGKMKGYELTLGTIQILIFIVSWLTLKAGYPAESVFIVAILANIIMFKIRLILVRKLVNLPMTRFYKAVILPISAVAVLSGGPSIILSLYLESSFISTVMITTLSLLLSTLSMFYIGLNKKWREKIKLIAISKLKKAGGAE